MSDFQIHDGPSGAFSQRSRQSGAASVIPDDRCMRMPRSIAAKETPKPVIIPKIALRRVKTDPFSIFATEGLLFHEM
ncbi:MAG: hypothetical protein HPM95_01775 [Alphaproteobacteria bacterium]|nr:hypothetical protein [Alphaproteobacteria bacterium]